MVDTMAPRAGAQPSATRSPEGRQRRAKTRLAQLLVAMATIIPPPPPPEYPLGRLFAPPDELSYVLRPRQLARPRGSARAGAIHDAVVNLDALAGLAGARAKSCAVAAVVGVLSYPDRSLVIAVATPRRLGEGGVRDVGVVVRTFLPFKPNARTSGSRPPTGRRRREGGAGHRRRRPRAAQGDARGGRLLRRAGLRADAHARAPRRRGGGWADADDRFVWNAAALSLADAGDGVAVAARPRLGADGNDRARRAAPRSLVARRSVDTRARGSRRRAATAPQLRRDRAARPRQTAHAPACSSFVQVRLAPPSEQRGKSVNPKAHHTLGGADAADAPPPPRRPARAHGPASSPSSNVVTKLPPPSSATSTCC